MSRNKQPSRRHQVFTQLRPIIRTGSHQLTDFTRIRFGNSIHSLATSVTPPEQTLGTLEPSVLNRGTLCPLLLGKETLVYWTSELRFLLQSGIGESVISWTHLVPPSGKGPRNPLFSFVENRYADGDGSGASCKYVTYVHPVVIISSVRPSIFASISPLGSPNNHPSSSLNIFKGLPQ